MRFGTWFATTILAVTIAASAASAATVVKLDMSHLVAHSDTIVVADVVDTRAEHDPDSGRVYTTISFRTDDALKGQPGTQFSIRQPGGRDGDIATHTPGMPQFQTGDRVFLFLDDFDEQPVVTGLSQGHFQIVGDPDEDTEFVVPRLGGVHLVEPDEAPVTPRPEGEPKLDRPDVDLREHAEVFRRIHQFDAFRHRVERTIDEQREEP